MQAKRGALAQLLNIFCPPEEHPQDDLLFEGDSSLHHITITDVGGYRTMCFGPNGEEAETSINQENPLEAVFEYPGMMLASLAICPEGHRVLMVGLGGGFLPGIFQKYLPKYQLTVVEIDPLVAELAKTYFGFSPSQNVNLVLGDGREYIDGLSPEAVDQIWLDAFSGDYVPPQLRGKIFLETCWDKLAPGGILVQNLHQSRPEIFQDQLKTTEAVFGSFLALDGISCGNAIVITRKPVDGELSDDFTWKKAKFKAMAKQIGPRLGPYDLVAELGKIKTFYSDSNAQIIP